MQEQMSNVSRDMKRLRETAQSCLTLSEPMDCSLPGSSAHGIFQATVLEWVAIVICISEVVDVSPSNVDSSLCFIQLAFCMMYSAYKLNKHGNNIQP